METPNQSAKEPRRSTRTQLLPSASIRLNDAELAWLAGFLVWRAAPATAMSIEQLDGFLTALVIGPDAVLPSEYLPVIWGADDGSGPMWEDTAQAEYVMGLLMRHWNAIAARRTAHAVHSPILEPFGEGEAWGLGFLQGVEMRADAWAPIFKDRRADQFVLPILALSGQRPRRSTPSSMVRCATASSISCPPCCK